jgi:DNA modification methylase
MEQLKHKIVCGDCLEHLKHIEDKSIDAIVTDPP